MRIINREEFLKMPVGTIYAKGKPLYFSGLTIRGDTVSDVDWQTIDPAYIGGDSIVDSGAAFDALQDMLKNGASYPMQDAWCRDGMFDDDDIFLIFERPDLIILQGFIESAIELAEIELSK